MTAAACHPGEVLAQKLKSLGVTSTELAQIFCVPANRITQIVNGKHVVTGDSVLCLARWLGDGPEQWMALQARYDLEVAKTGTGREIADLPTRAHLSASSAKLQTKPVQGRAP